MSKNGEQRVRDRSYDSVHSALQEALNDLVIDFDLPGAVASMITADGRQLTAASGLADRETGSAMTPRCRLLGASMGKSFVAAAIVSLIDAGPLSLDEPVSRWVRDRPWFAQMANADQLTLRNLLSHTSGLQDYVYQSAYQERRAKNRNPDWFLPHPEKLALVSGLPSLFSPGEGFQYTDLAYVLAGTVAEAATGMRLFDVIAERFIRPLELTLTAPSEQRALAGLAAGYMSPNDPFAALGLPPKVLRNGILEYNPASEWAGGGLISNPADLARWAKALYGGQVLTPEQLAQVLKPGIKTPLPLPWIHYGLGTMFFESPIGRLFGHWGNMPGYSGFMVYSPDCKVAFALQSNTTFFPLGEAQSRLCATLGSLSAEAVN